MTENYNEEDQKTGGPENQPVKLTITFADGHTQDFDVFVAVGTEGIVAAGIEQGRVYYEAMEEGFSTRAFASIAATTPVIAAILRSIDTIMKSITGSADPTALIELLAASSWLKTEKTTTFKDSRTIHKRPKEN